MNIQDLTFITPGYSVQDLSHRNLLTLPMGKVCPILFEYVNPGEVMEFDFSWFCRTFPMLAPLMDTMEVSFDAFWVPARTLSHTGGKSIPFDFEEFFNPRNLSSGISLPTHTLRQLVIGYISNYGRLKGTLYDYLGYPLLPEFFERLKNVLNSMYEQNGLPFTQFVPDDNLLAPRTSPLLPDPEWTGTNLNGANFSSKIFATTAGYRNFSYYVLLRWKEVFDDNGLTTFAGVNALAANNGVDTFTYICNQLDTTAQKLWDDWFAVICKQIFADIFSTGSTTWYSVISQYIESGLNLEDYSVSIVPFMVYSKIVYDWYVNPLLVDGDEEYARIWSSIIDNNEIVTDYNELSDLVTRLYEFDRFVSATPGGDQPNVLLPSTHGVKDIRTASATQLFLERVMKTGKRYVDQILTTFGIKPSDSRVDRSEVLFRRTAYLDMQQVTQTNQSSLSAGLANPLGSFAGNSMTFQSFNGGTFQFDEHGFFVVMASIRPKPSYMQGLDKFLRKLTADKFLVPDFARIGDDVIKHEEVYFDWNHRDTDFGYQQRYYEYASHLNEIHGHMVDELRYYHLARFFDHAPDLNETFTSVNVEQNDLARIWSTWDSSPFMMFIDFREKMLRPLPETTSYSL